MSAVAEAGLHRMRIEGALHRRFTPGVAVVAAAGAAVAIELGGVDAGPELCVVRQWTGGWCPGCGGARAARHVLHGDVGAAWQDHPWVVLALFQVAAVVAAAGVLRRRIGASAWRRGAALLGVVNGIALVAIWGIRLAVGAIPAPI